MNFAICSINRDLADCIIKASKSFKVVILTGARQVGKSTMLREIGAGREYVTLDDYEQRALAVEDPKGFLSVHKPPVTIDEIQYAPNLLPYIKMDVDDSDENGRYWLTGSQHFSLMKNVSESLAGRAAVFSMHPLSLQESLGLRQRPFCPGRDHRGGLGASAEKICTPKMFAIMQRGFYPQLWRDASADAELFYSSYLQTYISRDVRELNAVKDELEFLKFMRLIAARTGQILVYSDIASALGISLQTVKNWLSILCVSGIVYLLEPYFSNLGKRIVKSPKLYFADTGLCCYLTGWKNAEVLEKGAFAGAIMETYAVTEILKSYIHNGRSAPIYYYRDKDKREIDVLVHQDGRLHPVEIKKNETLHRGMSKSFSALDDDIRGEGAVLSMSDAVIPLSENVRNIPLWLI